MTDEQVRAPGHEHHHAHEPGHTHGPGHERGHDHGQHGHGGGRGVLARVGHVLRPHSHDAAVQVDAAMEASAEAMRELWISFAAMAATAVVQALVVAASGSVALLGDTMHKAVDALVAIPLGVAFVLGRRPPTRGYTYGYGRAEDLAGGVIVLVIAASSALVAYQAVGRLMRRRRACDLVAVAVAALVGFDGNELVARLPAPGGPQDRVGGAGR